MMIDIKNMDIKEIADYMNLELEKGRIQKDIEINDFGVNERVIKNRLNRKGYKKVNNQWIINNTNETTEIIQAKPVEEHDTVKQNDDNKKAFTNDEIEKLNKLLKLDIDTLHQMINDYTTSKNTNCSIKIKDNTSIVTSLRLNKGIYTLIKEQAQKEGIGISEIINSCMLHYLNK